MKRNSENGEEALEAIKAALAERALTATPWRPEADHRLAIYRTAEGHLMCLARSGLLVSEAPVNAAKCGTEQGCNGSWRCLASDQLRPEEHVQSEL